MEVSGVSATNSTNGSKNSVPKATDAAISLGEDAFMKLLLAQMRNQDPLKPMEDKDFIAQLAQFNSLNQLTQMSKTLDELVKSQSLSQGSALIGKTVSGLSSDGSVITGVVSALQMSGGSVTLEVDGKQIPLNNVHSVQQ
ncbi:MAG: flagellar hook assembly protein FlgD [Anaerolineae bacterium]